MTLLEFINKQEYNSNKEKMMNEAFRSSDVAEANNLILKLFRKNIDGKTVMFNDAASTTVGGKSCTSTCFINTVNGKLKMVWALNYLNDGSSTSVYSIDFFNKNEGSKLLFGSGVAKSSLTLYTLGQSVACFIPVICHVVNNNDFNISKEQVQDTYKSIIDTKVKESLFYCGALKYKVYEGLSSKHIESSYRAMLGQTSTFNEAIGDYVWEAAPGKSEAEQIKTAMYDKVKDSWSHKKDSPEANRYSIELTKEYNKVRDAIKGGATTKAELEVAIGHAIDFTMNLTKSEEKAEVELEKKALKDPEQAFKEMKAYVKSVLRGLQPGVILCGAPGIGKTYRVLQQLKAAGYVNGQNMHIIKGKCTTRSLYVDLYTFQSKGQIIVIDDADSLVGPKAPEDTINLLKAALDSTAEDEGRLVSYRVAGDIKDEYDNILPKEFYYNGAVIVITNYSVGQLDTALRGRVFTQSLDFSTEQLLQIIKNIMPGIDPERISSKSKIKAYDYLTELVENGTNMEISIRTFGTCARLYEICGDDPDFSEEDVRSMIKEQMENQAIRGGKKF